VAPPGAPPRGVSDRRSASRRDRRGRRGGRDGRQAEDDAFVCSTCGRIDLPPAGDWDPPICQECDAAINFDAILESEYFDHH